MNYTIRSGDTLSSIAQRNGTTVAELVRLNGIRNPDLIRAGATIRMPDAQGGATPSPAPAPPASPPSVPPQSSPGSYTVRSGDTLSRIASQNGTSVEALARLNGISNPNRIGVGQVIQLPPAQGGAPLPPPNIARPGVPGPPMDRGAPMQTGGGPAGYQPAGWTPVPAAGPVPTTQQWAANRPPTGSIGQGGDPAFDDIYGGGAAQPAPQAAPAAAAPPQDMWQGRQGAAYDPSQRSGIQSIGRGGLPDLRSMSMTDFNILRSQFATVPARNRTPGMQDALEAETQRRVDQLRAELTRIDQSNGMRQSREAAWQNAGEQMPRNPPAPAPSIPGNPTNPMPQGQPMPGVPLDPYGPASFQGAEARMSSGQPGNQRDPVAELIRQLRSGGGTNQVPVAALIRQLQGAA